MRTFLDLDPQEAGEGQRREPVPDAEGPRAPGVRLAAAQLREKGSARGRPPTPTRVARAGVGHNGPAGRADGPGPAAGRERETGGRRLAEGEGGRGQGPGGGTRLPGPQTQQRRGDTPAEAGPAGRARGEEEVAGLLR